MEGHLEVQGIAFDTARIRRKRRSFSSMFTKIGARSVKQYFQAVWGVTRFSSNAAMVNIDNCSCRVADRLLDQPVLSQGPLMHHLRPEGMMRY